MHSDQAIVKGLKQAIDDFTVYVIKNRLTLEQKDAKGQLYTCIRRYLNQIVNIRNGFSIANIDTIHWDINTGKILYIMFIVNYGGATNQKLIDLMNNSIIDLEPSLERKPYEYSINKVIQDLNYYTH